MKTAEELNALKNEAEALNKKLGELTKDELKQVTGGIEELTQVFGGTANQGETLPCKYCPEWTFQTWIGVDAGWDRDGNKHMCDLWLCEKCNCTNYRDISTGRLI